MLCYADAFSCTEVAAGAPASMLARFTRVSAAISVGRWLMVVVVVVSTAAGDMSAVLFALFFLFVFFLPGG